MPLIIFRDKATDSMGKKIENHNKILWAKIRSSGVPNLLHDIRIWVFFIHKRLI